MGLDSHLRGRRVYFGKALKDEEGFDIVAVEVDLGYWRKHWALQSYVTDHFGEGNDGSGPIDLSIEQLHEILDVADMLRDDEDAMTEEYRKALAEETREQITRAIAFLTIPTVLPDNSDMPTMWRSVFWVASW